MSDPLASYAAGRWHTAPDARATGVPVADAPGGGAELGGLEAVHHHLQRTAVQGRPAVLAALTAGERA